jgi:phage-related protein
MAHAAFSGYSIALIDHLEKSFAFVLKTENNTAGSLPGTTVVIYQEDDGTVPLLEWFDSIPTTVQDKRRVRIARPRELGHEWHRPEADYLRDGIYELRIGLRRAHYRMLYSFQRSIAAVLSHATTKEQRVPPREIDLAIRRNRTFEQNPPRHTYEAD